MNRGIWTGIVVALVTSAPMVLAQSVGAASPCPYGMTLTHSTITGTPKCLGKPINTYADYQAWMTNPNKSPTDNWLIGSAQPMSEGDWNAQVARAADDRARGITFGGGASAPTPTPSNTTVQGYDISGQNELPQGQQGFISNLPASTNGQSDTSTYAGYLAWMTNPNKSLTDVWLIGSAQPMSEGDWNAQVARAADDRARGITFGGGASAPLSVPAPPPPIEYRQPYCLNYEIGGRGCITWVN